jgi:tetratricopeptide (TPR) repeat protein
MYKKRERWIDAEIVLLNAATAAYSAFGVEHPNFWTILQELIDLFMETESFGMALQMAKLLYGVQYSALGAAHVKTFESSLLLALVYQAQDMHREAEEVMLSIIAAGSGSLEEDHPVILHAMAALATVYREVRMWKPAAKWEQRLLDHRITKLGGDHPETLRSMAELGWCLLKLEQWAEAEDLLVKVLEAKRVDKDMTGAEGHHSVLLLDLGLVYMRQQKLEDAEKVLLEALEIAETGDSQDKDCSYSAAGYLQEIYESTGRLERAQDLERYKNEMKETMEKKTADYVAKVQRRQQH